MYYFDELGEFHRQKVDYLVVGGLAVNLYGIPRVTQDIDILISFEKKNVEKLMDILKILDYLPRVPVDPMLLADPRTRKTWIKEKHMKVFSLYHKHTNFKVINIIILTPVSYEAAKPNRTTVDVKDIKIHLIGLDDLIQMKKVSGREQDLSDIKAIEKLKKFTEI
jgi:predicted nucleotidyltransferase